MANSTQNRWSFGVLPQPRTHSRWISRIHWWAPLLWPPWRPRLGRTPGSLHGSGSHSTAPPAQPWHPYSVPLLQKSVHVYKFPLTAVTEKDLRYHLFHNLVLRCHVFGAPYPPQRKHEMANSSPARIPQVPQTRMKECVDRWHAIILETIARKNHGATWQNRLNYFSNSNK